MKIPPYFCTLKQIIMFYVYHDGTHYLLITGVNGEWAFRRVKNITRATYWVKKNHAKHWGKHKIHKKYPNMVLKEAVLTLK